MTVHEEFSRAYTSYAARPGRDLVRRPPLLTVLARTLGLVLGYVLGKRGDVLTVAGLTLIAAGAWSWSRIAGLVVTGVALLVLEWAMRE